MIDRLDKKLEQGDRQRIRQNRSDYFLPKTLCRVFAQRLHLFERFSDLTSGLDWKGGISRLPESAVVFLPLLSEDLCGFIDS